MFEEEKLYSISDIAKKTKLTDRTIRNYLAKGKLKGRKIGGQWRFTDKDIWSLYSNDEFVDDMLAKSERSVNKYFNQELSFTSENNGCIILNFVVKDKETRKELFSKIKQIPTDEDKKEQISFIENDGRIKMIVIASYKYISVVMDLIKDVIGV